MRRIGSRPKLLDATLKKLEIQAKAVSDHSDPKSEADRRFKNARKTVWFDAVVQQLKKVVGEGFRCMLCDGSEASDVEHYRPKSRFPEHAFAWDNYLWSCTICNRSKLNRFPPDTEPGGRIINPFDDDVWSFLFIDEFGLLIPQYRTDISRLDERGEDTIRILDLNRQGVQESRKSRRDDLVEKVEAVLRDYDNGSIDVAKIRSLIRIWLKVPFQPDVADFYLRGPGGTKMPFSKLLAIVT